MLIGYQIHISAVFLIAGMLAWEQSRLSLLKNQGTAGVQTLSNPALCYGYSSLVHIISGVFLFLLGLASVHWLIFGPRDGLLSTAIGLLIVGFSIWAMPKLKDMQSRIYFLKDGLAVLYFNKRSQWIGWNEIACLEPQSTILGRLWYWQGHYGRKAFLFHNSLMESQELVCFVKDRIKEFNEKIQKPSD